MDIKFKRIFECHSPLHYGDFALFFGINLFQKYSKFRKVDVIKLRTDQNVMLHNENFNLTGHC